MFVQHPEMLVSLAICTVMRDNEAIAITGARKLVNTGGYGRGLTYTGRCTVDPAPRFGVSGGTGAENAGSGAASSSSSSSSSSSAAGSGASSSSSAYPSSAAFNRSCSRYGPREKFPVHPATPKRCAIAFDATHFQREDSLRRQLSENNTKRDVLKAAAAFAIDGLECGKAQFPAVSSGHWGCGAFNGHRGRAMIVQWIAASIAGRRLHYCMFNDEQPRKASIDDAARKLADAGATAIDLERALLAAARPLQAAGSGSSHSAASQGEMSADQLLSLVTTAAVNACKARKAAEARASATGAGAGAGAGGK